MPEKRATNIRCRIIWIGLKRRRCWRRCSRLVSTGPQRQNCWDLPSVPCVIAWSGWASKARRVAMMRIDLNGWLDGAAHLPSPNFDAREAGGIELLVIHNISLPPGEFGGDGVERLFTNTLNRDAHPYYRTIPEGRVSSHFYIRRDGRLIQFVSVLQRAWHAGLSVWQGRERCNDFSIGVELEGSDFVPF